MGHSIALTAPVTTTSTGKVDGNAFRQTRNSGFKLPESAASSYQAAMGLVMSSDRKEGAVRYASLLYAASVTAELPPLTLNQAELGGQHFGGGVVRATETSEGIPSLFFGEVLNLFSEGVPSKIFLAGLDKASQDFLTGRASPVAASDEVVAGFARLQVPLAALFGQTAEVFASRMSLGRPGFSVENMSEEDMLYRKTFQYLEGMDLGYEVAQIRKGVESWDAVPMDRIRVLSALALTPAAVRRSRHVLLAILSDNRKAASQFHGAKRSEVLAVAQAALVKADQYLVDLGKMLGFDDIYDVEDEQALRQALAGSCQIRGSMGSKGEFTFTIPESPELCAALDSITFRPLTAGGKFDKAAFWAA